MSADASEAAVAERNALPAGGESHEVRSRQSERATGPALQRVVVRMLHDWKFVAQVLAEPVPGLTEAELGWLRAVDPRRWRSDPLRRYRLLQSVIEEFPAACAVVVRRAGVPTLDLFMSSQAFHQAIEAGEVLALAFGRWLCTGLGPEVAALASLEEAVARSRRAMQRAQPPGHLALAQGYVPVAPLAGTLAAWQDIVQRLDLHGRGRLAAVSDEKWRIPLPDLGAHTEGLLVEPGPRIGEAGGPVVAFLLGLPRPPDAALASLIELGAEPQEAIELIDEFLRDGVVVRT